MKAEVHEILNRYFGKSLKTRGTERGIKFNTSSIQPHEVGALAELNELRGSSLEIEIKRSGTGLVVFVEY